MPACNDFQLNLVTWKQIMNTLFIMLQVDFLKTYRKRNGKVIYCNYKYKKSFQI